MLLPLNKTFDCLFLQTKHETMIHIRFVLGKNRSGNMRLRATLLLRILAPLKSQVLALVHA